MTNHILQCYITKFSSTPTLWKYNFGSRYIFGYGKSPHNKHFITRLSCMATLGEAPEWESAITLGQHTLSSSRTTLQPHGHRHSTYYTLFTWRVNRRYRLNLDTVFTYKSLCNGYKIDYTNRIGNVYYISHSVIDFMLSKFSVYRIIVFFSQRQAFAAYRSASSGPVENILPTILMSKIIIFIIF